MQNLRGSLLMVLAMAAFAIEDMFIKLLSSGLPMGQVVVMLGFCGAIAFSFLARLRGQRIWSPLFFSRPILLRNLGEMIATAGFVSAIVLTTLSSASAILQAAPLAVTLGAAVFLGEPVGWRRWTAITIGFTGVLLIIRPGLEGFAPASLLGVMAVAGLALRDLAVRTVPGSVGGAQISLWAMTAVMPTGVLMMLAMGTPPEMPVATDLWRVAAAVVVGVAGYYAVVAATRTGDVSVVVPFRYTRLIFAIIVGMLVFGERPDALTLTGAALIVTAGLYTIWRETHVVRRPVSSESTTTSWH